MESEFLRRYPVTGTEAQGGISVGHAHDPAEKEADRRAHEAMSRMGEQRRRDAVLGPDGGQPATIYPPPPAVVARSTRTTSRVRRSAHAGDPPIGIGGGSVPEPLEGRIGRVRRSAHAGDPPIGIGGGSVPEPLEERIGRVRRSAAQPLPTPLRASMEDTFGHDLGGVRLHTDRAAADVSANLGASAFATGNDIFFGRNAYRPESRSGQHLLAHEVAHTLENGPRSGAHSPQAGRVDARRHPSQVIRRHYLKLPNVYGVTDLPPEDERETWKIGASSEKGNQAKTAVTAVTETDLVMIKDAVIDRACRHLPSPKAKEELRKRIEDLELRLCRQNGTSITGSDLMTDRVTAPARAFKDRIEFNLSAPDYYMSNGHVDPVKVKSTVVHELYHSASADAHGLQDVADLIENTPRHQPDEAVTDQLAAETFHSLFGDKEEYRSGYMITAPKGSASAWDDAVKKDSAEKGEFPIAWTGEMMPLLRKVTGVSSNDELFDMYFASPDLFKKKAASVAGDYPKAQSGAKEEWQRHQVDRGLARGVLPQAHKQSALDRLMTVALAAEYLRSNLERRKVLILRAFNASELPKQKSPAHLEPVWPETTLKGFSATNRFLELAKQLAPKVSQDEYETNSEAVDTSGQNPALEKPPIDTTVVTGHAKKLGIPIKKVIVVAVPARIPGEGTTILTVKMNTALENYPKNFVFDGTSQLDKKHGLDYYLKRDGETGPAYQVLEEKYLGGGYETNDRVRMVVLNADRFGSPRTLLHEMGHLRQDLGSENSAENAWVQVGHETYAKPMFNEHNTANIILEYHNVLKHENLDPEYIRTHYKTVPASKNHTWTSLERDRDLSAWSRLALREIDSILKTPKYRDYAELIRANLIAEYFG